MLCAMFIYHVYVSSPRVYDTFFRRRLFYLLTAFLYGLGEETPVF